ncbi:MAG: OadG family protein [bacterium]|nr:OadG family protein [bacterium]
MLLNFAMILFIMNALSLIDVERASLIKQGLSIGIVGISVVFSGLMILMVLMKLFIFFLNYSERKSQDQAIKPGAVTKTTHHQLTGEVVTAISLAIHQSREEFHDLEETIITFQRITRPYSPWSSKIHQLRRGVRL